MRLFTDEYGKIAVYKKYVIATLNEGITISSLHTDGFNQIANDILKNQNFGYISNRINSYAIDPKIYIDISEVENLVAFAMVSDNPLHISNAEIEKLFLKKPFKTFTNIEPAVKWIKKMEKKTGCSLVKNNT